MSSPQRLAASLLLLASLACQRGPAGPRPDPSVLTQAEMREHNFTNVYDAVAALRPNWLTVRGADSFQSPSQLWVYFDQTRLGGVDQLRPITVASVAWVRHYSGTEATTRWGINHGSGVIFVSSHE
jgi:hypothetical protein